MPGLRSLLGACLAGVVLSDPAWAFFEVFPSSGPECSERAAATIQFRRRETGDTSGCVPQTSATIYLCLDTSSSGAIVWRADPCAGRASSASEVCFWDLDIRSTGVEITSYEPPEPPTGGAEGYAMSYLADPHTLSVNGGRPDVGENGTRVLIGSLEVQPTAASGEVWIAAAKWVDTNLDFQPLDLSDPIRLGTVSAVSDRDCDAKLDAVDVCPYFVQTSDSDVNGDGEEMSASVVT